jgi:hypothetical protein
LRDAKKQLLEADKQNRQLTARLQRLESLEAPLRNKAEASHAQKLEADHEVTRSKTLLDNISERREAFDRLIEQKICNACGQALTEEHAQSEHARLESQQAVVNQEYLQALERQKTVGRREKRLDDKYQKIVQLCSDSRRKLTDWQRLRELAERTSRNSESDCTQAYQELPETFRLQIAPKWPADWLATTFPHAADLDHLQQELTAIPADKQDSCEQTLRLAQQRRDRLVDRRDQRLRLEKEFLELEQNHHRLRQLADLLGRNGLQLHLVRQAENRIVEYANAVLDRLSGGQLYLRLRKSGDGESAADQALQLEAINRAAGQTPIGVSFLSGSQRFRVAVSLALGIGRYASRQHRPIESVIIDEGFGCLDRQGRQSMIQELNNLKGQLRSILLVSHQEEFADAFPDGYRFELVDGTTVASRFHH